MEPQEAAYGDRVPLETLNILGLSPHRNRGCALGSLWLRQSSPLDPPAVGDEPEDHRHAETPSFPPLTATRRFPQSTVQGAHRMLTQECWRRHASAVGYAVVRVLPMTCRNSASLRVHQSSGRVALYLVVGTLRSRTAESYANAGVRPVAITTPELSFVGIGYRHGGRHLLSLRLPPLLLPSLSLRGTIAAQVLTCCHTDTRASCVSVGYRHGGHHLLTA